MTKTIGLVELELGGRTQFFSSPKLANEVLRKQGLKLVETVTGWGLRALHTVKPPQKLDAIPVHGGGYSGNVSRDVKASQLARKQLKSAQAVEEAKAAMQKAGSRVMGETPLHPFMGGRKNNK